MKRTRHRYHYAIRSCKKNKLKIQKQKLAENISNSTNFWKELKKINPANNLTTTIMDNAQNDKEITELLLNKYETLYNSVKTSDIDIAQLHSIIDHGINSNQLQGMLMTPNLISHCIKQLKKREKRWELWVQV